MDFGHLDYSFDRPVRAADLMPLLAQTHWAGQRREADVERMLQATPVKLGVWQGQRLVAFARVLTDGRYRALIDDVIVDRPLRGQGIGTRIMEELAVRLAGVEEVFLRCDPEQVPFYRRLGYDHKATCLDLIHRGPASRNSHRQGGR